MNQSREVTCCGCSYAAQDALDRGVEFLIAPADRVVMEGDNQKQADFLSRSLVKVDPKKVHDLHLIISSISRPEPDNDCAVRVRYRSLSESFDRDVVAEFGAQVVVAATYAPDGD